MAEVRVTKDRAMVKSFDGRETVYQYAQDRLDSVTSARGTTRYEYTEDGKRLAAVHFPDHSIQRFQWHNGLGVTRLTTWRELPPETKTARRGEAEGRLAAITD